MHDGFDVMHFFAFTIYIFIFMSGPNSSLFDWLKRALRKASLLKRRETDCLMVCPCFLVLTKSDSVKTIIQRPA